MGILIKDEHLRRYKDIAKLLVKYGSYDLLRRIGLEGVLDPDWSPTVRAAQQGRELANDLEGMGPTFVKLGQVLSTRPDILPTEYAQALERLQSDVESFDYDQVKAIVESELGKPIEDAFAEFSAVPLAAASIGQVHRARLHGGREVAVKVQRPGIHGEMMADLEVLEQVAEFIDKHTELGDIYKVGEVFQEFRASLMQELDYLQEKRNILAIRGSLKGFDRIIVPDVIATHSTSRVLTMEFIEGVKISALTTENRAALDADNILVQLFKGYLKQVLLDGCFHADPHAGNLVVTPDGKIAMLDLGMVARITPGIQDRLIRFLLAVSQGQPEDAAEIAASMGDKLDTYDPRRYRRRAVALLSRYQSATLSQIHLGTLMTEFADISGECGIRVPRDLAMLGKVLIHLDQTANMLNPQFDPLEHIRESAAELLVKHVARDISAGNLFQFLLAVKDIAKQLPRTMGFVLDQVASNELRVKVEAFDEKRFLFIAHRLANRIALALLIGSMMIGAGILSATTAAATIMGYPAAAFVMLVLASVGALALMVDMIINDGTASGRKRD
jgi:predicted unusual protein kinase regulating ubiquinone biosynthesis (AarF/ABC1/UbiB family)